MIKAAPNNFAKSIFKVYLNRLFRNHFLSFNLIGESPKVDNNLPVLLIPNHSTWWDGFFSFYINDYFFKKPFYLMMLEDQLKKFNFFRKLGAFSINPQNPSETLKSLRYTINILNDESVFMCLFPQGELVSWFENPPEFKKGLDLIIKKIRRPLNLLELMIRIEYTGEQYPQVFFLFGKNRLIEPGEKFNVQHYSENSNQLRNRIIESLSNNDHGTEIFKGRRSVSTFFSEYKKLW